MNCPCGQPACWRIWEAPIAFCQKHGRAWLASEEKKIVGDAIMEHYRQAGSTEGVSLSQCRTTAAEIPGAREAFLRFVARVERDARLWLRIKRRFGGGR
jgi:hypothetical protein